MIADITIKKYNHAISLLDPASPDYAEQTGRIEAERKAFQLQECQKRAERYYKV